MKFEINSSDINFRGRNFIAFFENINKACNCFGISYFVVGAFARDIILKNIFNKATGLDTQDIDIAIRLDNWGNYQRFIDYLKTNCGFSEGRNTYTFISPEGVLTDILAYGEIEVERSISFPPDFRKVINMFGFQEVSDACVQIRFDGKIDLKIVSTEGIAILKFIAWKDREPARVSEKHTNDIGLIINAYFDAKVSEFAVEFSDLFSDVDDDDFDATLCGTRALGRRMRQLSNSSNPLVDELTQLFSYILKDKDNSLFVKQLATFMRYEDEFAYRTVEALAQGFQEFQS